VRIVELGEAAFGVVWGFTGEPQRIPWDRIVLISAGGVHEVHETRTAAAVTRRGPGVFAIAAGLLGGISLGVLVHNLRQDAFTRGGPAGQVSQQSWPHPIADVFAAGDGPEYLHIRLRSRDLYYDKILGDDYRPDYFSNFRLVLARIGMRATGAMVSPETQVLLAAEGARAAEKSDAWFGEESEFTQYNRWLLQTIALGHAQPL
jgi:hypothetical protein